jgi:hypothetical protein
METVIADVMSAKLRSIRIDIVGPPIRGSSLFAFFAPLRERAAGFLALRARSKQAITDPNQIDK